MNDLTWNQIAQRLADPKNYWLVSVAPDGAPHTVPVWGAIEGDALMLYTEQGTVKARNVTHDPRVIVHLESGADVLIVHGTAVELTEPAEVLRACAAFAAKYTEPDEIDWLPKPDPTLIVWRLEPTHALAWQLDDMDGSQQRWRAN